MSAKHSCPDCNKKYDQVPMRCVCGWYLTQEVVSNVDRTKCHYVENNLQCNQPGSVGLRAKSNEWYCGKHAEQLREQSYDR